MQAAAGQGQGRGFSGGASEAAGLHRVDHKAHATRALR